MHAYVFDVKGASVYFNFNQTPPNEREKKKIKK